MVAIQEQEAFGSGSYFLPTLEGAKPRQQYIDVPNHGENTVDTLREILINTYFTSVEHCYPLHGNQYDNEAISQTQAQSRTNQGVNKNANGPRILSRSQLPIASRTHEASASLSPVANIPIPSPSKQIPHDFASSSLTTYVSIPSVSTKSSDCQTAKNKNFGGPKVNKKFAGKNNAQAKGFLSPVNTSSDTNISVVTSSDRNTMVRNPHIPSTSSSTTTLTTVTNTLVTETTPKHSSRQKTPNKNAVPNFHRVDAYKRTTKQIEPNVCPSVDERISVESNITRHDDDDPGSVLLTERPLIDAETCKASLHPPGNDPHTNNETPECRGITGDSRPGQTDNTENPEDAEPNDKTIQAAPQQPYVVDVRPAGETYNQIVYDLPMFKR